MCLKSLGRNPQQKDETGESEKTPNRRGEEQRKQRKKAEVRAPFDDGSRHFGERANICRWIGGLKGRQIWTRVDSQGIGIASSEGEKGRVIPFRDIGVGGVKIPVDFILVAREWGKDKILGPASAAAAEAGGGAAAAGAGGGTGGGG